MPNDAKLSREIEKVSKEVTTVQEMTELVSWDGVVRATFTTFKIVDGNRYPIETVTTSRNADTDPSLSDWLDDIYTRAEAWMAEDAKPTKEGASDVALDAKPVVP